ncbi:FecR/PupR family sigma factor regulator [Duganella lactea]|nr:hypothetical protein [Duganella lactea]
MQRWLAADPRHCKQYDKACRLWMLSGMIPPAFGDESAINLSHQHLLSDV